MIIWVDESGFYLLPSLVNTYAPRGQTPIVHALLSQDHLAGISGITAQGKLYMQLEDQPLDGLAIVRFLKHLLRHIPGKIVLIWDRSPIHRARVVKRFLAAEADGRIHVEPLPAYAPELNPDEGVWHYLKYVELRNVACGQLDTLRAELKSATKRLQRKPNTILGFILEAGYNV